MQRALRWQTAQVGHHARRPQVCRACRHAGADGGAACEGQAKRSRALRHRAVLPAQPGVRADARELDLDAAQPVWTVPKERFKVDPHNKDFKVPLAPQFVRVLREQLGYLEAIYGVPYSGYVWPAVTEDRESEWISDATMLRYLQRTMKMDATVHGFRASYKTWARGQFLEGTDATRKYHHYAIEYCQAHTTPDNRGWTGDPYSRDQMMYPARIVIMRDWANYCDPLPQVRAIQQAA